MSAMGSVSELLGNEITEGPPPPVYNNYGIIPFFPRIMVASELHENGTGTECICSDLQHEDYSPLYEWFNYVIIIIMLPSLSVFGVMTNVVNVFIYSRRRMYTSSNTYLLFLSCSDFMVIVTGLFIFWVDSARSYIAELAHAPYTTVYTLPVGYMAQTCSIYFTVAAAVDCYINVCWKKLSSRYCTVKRARQIVTYITVCSVLYNSLRFPQFNLRRCFHEGSQEEIIEICPTALFFTINTIYNVYAYMVLMTLLPFFFLLLLNAFIVVKQSLDSGNVANTPKTTPVTPVPSPFRTQNGKHYSAMNSCAPAHKWSTTSQSSNAPLAVSLRDGVEMDVYPFGKSLCHNHTLDDGAAATASRSLASRRCRKRSKKESLDELIRVAGKRVRRVSMTLSGLQGVSIQASSSTTDDTITMIMVVVLFLCCNTLALVVNLIETFFEPDALLLNLLSDASNFLVIFNSSVNMVIYLIFNTEYRDLLLRYCHRTRARICACLLKRDKTTAHERVITVRAEPLDGDVYDAKKRPNSTESSRNATTSLNNGSLVANVRSGGYNSSAPVWLPMADHATIEEVEETPTVEFKNSQGSYHLSSSRSFDPSADLPLLMVDDDNEQVWYDMENDFGSMPTSITMYESDISNTQTNNNCMIDSLSFPHSYSYIPLLREISDADMPVTSL